MINFLYLLYSTSTFLFSTLAIHYHSLAQQSSSTSSSAPSKRMVAFEHDDPATPVTEFFDIRGTKNAHDCSTFDPRAKQIVLLARSCLFQASLCSLLCTEPRDASKTSTLQRP